ncbi:uncharacterized protein LOC109836129 [Asparagus officinalis]|uniref:uncharacterized protein LOC109836129 n=1 Tax=Asparagus officinalis TaxID=4686 RepID=UPI00098E79C4|nr:uncharacterized protein LOC109836129 [Asparagus officinalis]
MVFWYLILIFYLLQTEKQLTKQLGSMEISKDTSTLQIERQLTKQLENMEISKDTNTLQPNPENKHYEQSNLLTSPSSQPGFDQLTSQQAQQRGQVSNSPPS